eukprot:NODE_2993_length_959_cov_18.998798_g2973_i0.p2 GENE.NODE_2993_length_959_cov_18.998798_g2973_i0~~NODE_2993_length_959_cov_18.998798_g2973_i0.p2  ORF type:complete len:268 (+),score=90.62 NODE_2993_length_959_cov_18.998798_g2973_i0:73-804(+)
MAADEDVLAVAFLCVFPLFTFLGEKVFKPTVAGAGFSALGYAVFWATRDVGALSSSARLGLVFAAGVVGAVAVVAVFKAGVFLCGAVSGVLLCNLAYQVLVTQAGADPSRDAHYVALALCGVVGGMVALRWWKYAVRVVTAFMGSYMGVAGVSHFIWSAHGKQDSDNALAPRVFFAHAETFTCDDDACYAMLGGWAVLFVLGMAVQFHLGPSLGAEEDEDEEADAEYFRLAHPTTLDHDRIDY